MTTGDAIDNAQWNEVQAFLALFDGGRVSPDSGGPDYAGVQALDWPDDIFWKPDGHGPDGPDFFRRELGFPHHPGLLERHCASSPRAAWACPGCPASATTRRSTRAWAGRPRAGRRADRRPEAAAAARRVRHDQALELFTVRPEAFMAGPSRQVPPIPAAGRSAGGEFVAAHFRPGVAPARARLHRARTAATAPRTTSMTHRRSGSSRWTPIAWPAGPTGAWTASRPAGWKTGSPRCTRPTAGRTGSEIRTGHDDRLVILFSHHGMDTLDNTRVWHPGPGGEPLIGAAELVALLHRFPNVVLWLNGHTHTNAIRPRRDPADPARGFWEVTTCAVVDWPCQTRRGGAGRLRRAAVHHLHHGGSRHAARTPGAGWAGAVQPMTWPRCIASWRRTSRSAARTRAGPGPPPTGTWSCGSARRSRSCRLRGA